MRRLLHVESLDFSEFQDDQRPPYVAASHRWLSRSETTFQDVRDRCKMEGAGYRKVEAFARYVGEHLAPIKWLWIDTCCIKKDSAAELSEAINSMFDWYHDADLCLAYLADVDTVELGPGSSFEKSQWFRRGWTLQELLAPRVVLSVTVEWHVVGHKGSPVYNECQPSTGRSLDKIVSRSTGIPEAVLQDYGAGMQYTIDEKMRWMEGRKTTRPEDMAYSMFGILGVTLPVIYGEKYDRASRRLEDVIRQRGNVAAQQAEQYKKIVDWLAPPDPYANHESARQLHQPCTGTWLTGSAEYQDWKGSLTRHLWIYGKAGLRESQPGAVHAIFYFSFSDQQKQRLADLLRSLVAQLGWKEPALSTSQRSYNKPGRPVLGLEELESVLAACFQSYNEVFLLIDALDVCPENDDVRHEMLQCLARLSRKAHQVKIFATSRELLDVRGSMMQLEARSMAIPTRSVNDDIRQYIAAQLSRHHRLSRLSPKTKTEIEETISAKADGMFRWAYCQLQELKKLKVTKPKYIAEALHSLPATLDATYNRMLRRIEIPYRQEAIVLLQWLAYAESPPSLGELAEATIIDPTGEGCVEVAERGGLEDTLEILSGLVVILGDEAEDNEIDDRRHDDACIPEQTRKVKLAHFSVKEYLESERILESSVKKFYLESAVGHKLLAQSCLTYLMHYSRSSEKSSIAQDRIDFPLLRYAAQSWFYHTPKQPAHELEGEVSILNFQGMIRNWLCVLHWVKPLRTHFGYALRTGSGLYYASMLGLDAVVSELLVNGADNKSLGKKHDNVIHAASSKDHEKIMQMLLDCLVDPDTPAVAYSSALQEASLRGHEKVVQMLLDAGGDVYT
ncbi:hypothetical protein LTR62_003278 [Meristemomyces frigidus]|uniref:Heterokaryon incompatibility domain-containing protein n=1 Tax=Meristemomyces frigidus TaxID=1508187 RepID=A0AAN7TJ34_9PEZI|nr:hypothetical protein LTR62_003278 [Meristemomyces frigidus]